MNEYYTYALIDPRTEKPFYIGKGKGTRYNDHLAESLNTDSQSIKCKTIRKLISIGLEYGVVISDNLTEDDAFEIEEMLISDYGRIDIKTGILANHSNGGEGNSGYIVSDERKRELSELLKVDNLMHRSGVLEKVSGENHWCFGKEHPSKGRKIWSNKDKLRLSELAKNQVRQATSEDTKEKIRQAHLGRTVDDTSKFHWERKKVECPHCDKAGSIANMKRWHFDNCKELKDAS